MTDKIMPQVGDVWENNRTDHKFYVYEIDKYYISGLFEGVLLAFFEIESFVRNFTYLGKAKGSIKDLFEVDDENS